MSDGSKREEAQRLPAPTRVVYSSAELFQGRKVIFIEHEQEMYCLRITSKDKLLLTK